MFIEEWFIPILIVVFFTGILIGINIGVICSNKCNFNSNEVEIPQYVLRPPNNIPSENFTMRYPNNRTTHAYSRGRTAGKFNY